MENRAFQYGDGLFETMRMHQGKILFLERHWQRLLNGMAVLKMEWPGEMEMKDLENALREVVPGEGDFRVRLSVWRSGAGLYTPISSKAEYSISSTALPEAPYSLNAEGLEIGLYEDLHLHYNLLSPLKTLNALPYVLAGIYKKEQGLDDCLLLNSAGRIAEASSSNIFVIRGKNLWTPPLTEACIAGVMRSVLLDLAGEAGWIVEEKPLEGKRPARSRRNFSVQQYSGDKMGSSL